jgi:hypothetical protein
LHNANTDNNEEITTENHTIGESQQEYNTVHGLPKFITHLPKRNKDEILHYSETTRKTLQLEDEQQLLLAIAWVTPFEKRLFNLFPRCIFVDCTASTNKEQRPCFTVTGRDSHGKMFTILRSFFPNEKAWMFRWIFSCIIPNSFHKDTLQQIVYVCSDGDASEYQQLDISISSYFPNATRGRCGWHLIDGGWRSHGPRCGSQWRSRLTQYSQITSIVTNWMYSWKRYMEPHEKYYVYYLKKKLRHYGAYCNCGHEGTNKGLKYCADAVNPSNPINLTAEKLSDHATRSYASSVANTSTQSQKTCVWNNIKCSSFLVDNCVNLIYEQWRIKSLYESIKVEPHKWLVKYARSSLVTKEQTVDMHPVFQRIRTVNVVNEIFYCSCSHFEVYGYPCRHMFHVMTLIPDHEELSICDVGIE